MQTTISHDYIWGKVWIVAFKLLQHLPPLKHDAARLWAH